MNSKIPCRLFALVMVFLIGSNESLAQLSAYHGIVFPYDNPNRQLLTSGGFNAAIPDIFSGIQINPAGLSNFTTPRVSAVFRQVLKKDNISFKEDGTSVSSKKTQFYPGGITGLLPVGSFRQPFIFTLSVNYIPAPEFDHYDALEKAKQIQFYHRMTGNVWNSSLGISRCLFNNFHLGLSVTKWLGNWTWQDSTRYFNAVGSGKFNYSGTHVTLGMLYQLKDLRIGLTLYSPFTLMVSSRTYTWNWLDDISHTIEQKFNGGARIGVAYRINPRLSFGAGYRYQNQITMSDQTDNEYFGKVVSRYNESHQLSITLERIMQIKTLSIPVFLAYQGTMMPESPGSSVEYLFYTFKKKSKYSHTFTLGSNIQIQSFRFYLSTQWDYLDTELNLRNLEPPYS